MSEFQSSLLLERNPVTHRIHRHEVLWQITVPLLLGVLVILALMALTIVSAVRGLSLVDRWADISLIWLILPMLFVTLLFALITGAIAYGIIKLIGVLPRYTLRGQGLVGILGARVHQISDAVAAPFIKVDSFGASLKATQQRLRRR